ncbi:hypothetical protein [Halanaerobium salsuginis]|jgi:Skp family chaperone for outer membrane proteins|uniref:Uncharacterized protein n=1 Tax=Halanaerobium salsuginis TaxID=29563 RepID=A0A1I4KCS2_9FIRM|nr:hypothetical protein [Halanaerobium salsuginis]SFL76401.1 hypothetical protein SAMN02983006_01966 [Halanaerobium salsuginis]
MALFGSDTIAPFHEINKIINEIFISAQMLGEHYWKRQGRKNMTDEEFEKHLKEMHKHEAVFWEMSEEDELLKRLYTAIKKVEKVCSDVLSK